MSDGSGHLATLGVYHDLHCVVSNTAILGTTKNDLKRQKVLRQWIYKDYYFSNRTQDDISEGAAHAGQPSVTPLHVVNLAY